MNEGPGDRMTARDLWLLEQEKLKLALERCAKAFREFLEAWRG